MAAFSFSRQSQPAVAQPSTAGPSLFATARSTNGSSSSDPLQPLRAMADRVGKEVEKFAERVDHWHTHGNENSRAKYQTTVKMVGKFRDLAKSHVEELKKTAQAENEGDLNRSIRQRIRIMTDAVEGGSQAGFGQSLKSQDFSLESGNAADSANLRDLRQWQAELATWELLQVIIEHYHPDPGTDVAAQKKERLANVGGTGHYGKNSEIWDRFLLEDDQAKEKALILRWLQQTAQQSETSIEAITAELEAQSGKGTQTWTSGWQDTRSKIKQAKRLEGTDQPLKSNATLKTADKTAHLVTQLDPDSATRQKRALEKPDEYYERALWMVCYEMMRRGEPWNKIADWCQERNEAWRGISIGAACDEYAKDGPNLAGPTAGYLFRRMCFYASRGARIPYETAVYGLLSGDLKQVQTVARSWDDHLYAHYNALLLSRFDTYLQTNYPLRITESLKQKFVFQDAVVSLGDWEQSSRKVVHILKQQKATASQATSPIKLIQGALISRTHDELMLKVGVVLAELLQNDERPQCLIIHPDSNLEDPGPKPKSEHRTWTAEEYYLPLATDPQAFRILVHVFIVFRNGFSMLGSRNETRWHTLDNVIAAYIEFLRISKRIQLIPVYAAQLLPERAAHCLARILPDIRNPDEQQLHVGLLEQLRIDVIQVVAQSFTFAFQKSGFTRFDGVGRSILTKPISRFVSVDQVIPDQHQILWPGIRIKRNFGGSILESNEESIIEALQWYHYVGNDYEQTFQHLTYALSIFLLSGRLSAAEHVVNGLSVETLSISRTEALCGYPFDFTAPGAEEQDERELHDYRDKLTGSARATAIPIGDLPDANRHKEIVEQLRQSSSEYYHLQQMVRFLVLIREWREEEETQIQYRNDRAKDSSPGSKPDTQRTKELLEAITGTFESLIASISDAEARGLKATENFSNVKIVYFPDLVLAYLVVLQSASHFMHRDPAIQAMEVAVLVADERNKWLQEVFVQTGRMTELVDCLANVSKAMLRLSEMETTKAEKKKRGSKGETLRIWDLGSRERAEKKQTTRRGM